MKWEMCLVVTVYDRGQWNAGLPNGPTHVAEELFTAKLDNAHSDRETATVLSYLTRNAEAWLKRVQASLIEHVVVTVYSLEVS